MRICYVINGLNGGGAAFPMIDVIRVMRARGHDVRVIALMRQDGRAAARLEQAGIPYEIIGSGPRDFAAAGIKFLRRLRADRPDLLWTSLTRATVFGQIAGRLLGIPVVSWQHSAFLKPGNLAIMRRTRGLTRRWVADSVAVKHFLQLQVGVAADQIDIWPLFAANPDAPQAAAWTDGTLFRIGSLGRLHPDKRFDVVIRAAARVRELNPALSKRIEFVIVGDGAQIQALKALAAELRVDNVRFPGFEENTAPFLASLHAYIQPSRKEGLCLAAHEAMQAGLPIIASPVGEIANSVLNGETGWLCAIGDVEAFARAILALAGDPSKAAQMGRASRLRVIARFDPNGLAAAGHSILEQIERDLKIGPVPLAGATADGAPAVPPLQPTAAHPPGLRLK